MKTKKFEDKTLKLEDIVVLRKWQKGLIITDLYGETFCLSNEEFDTEAIFDTVIFGNNMHYFENGSRYLNLDLIKDTKIEVKPAANLYAVKVLLEGGHVETFNCSNEIEARSFYKKIISNKKDSQNALEI